MSDLADIADECIHGLTTAFCSICKAQHAAAEKRRRLTRAKNADVWETEETVHPHPSISLDYPHTQAKYDGLCPDCDEHFHEGDWIYLVGGSWLDEECARDRTILNGGTDHGR